MFLPMNDSENRVLRKERYMAKSTSFSQRQESLKRSVMARRSAFSEADESMQPLELYFGPKEGQIVHLELARIDLAPDHPRQR